MLVRATENVVAGHIWPVGRYLPTPALDQCSTTGVTRHNKMMYKTTVQH